MSGLSSRTPVCRLSGACGGAALWLLLAALFAPSGAHAEGVMERMTRLARAGEASCADPWTYSRGLGKCICIKAGYSKQWGQCLPMAPGLAADKTQAGRDAMTSALPKEPPAVSEGDSTGSIASVAPEERGAPSSPERAATPQDEASDSETPARRMEQIAQAQDCLASLELYDGAVDGEGNDSTMEAYRRFAETRGLPPSDDLSSVRAQAALRGACGARGARAETD